MDVSVEPIKVDLAVAADDSCDDSALSVVSTSCSRLGSKASALEHDHAFAETIHSEHAEPSNVLLFFDWDDTLYPTTEIHDRWQAIQDRWRALADWENALCTLLEVACQVSGKVVILTNALRPWVTNCINDFAPKIAVILNDFPDTLEVVYAREYLTDKRCLRPRKHANEKETKDEYNERLTLAKYSAMKSVANSFYGNRPWRNIISFGDAAYEHDALQELTFKRAMSHCDEHVLSKAVLLKEAPSMIEMTFRLNVLKLILPTLAQAEIDVDLNVSEPGDLHSKVAAALRLPDSSAPLLPCDLGSKLCL